MSAQLPEQILSLPKVMTFTPESPCVVRCESKYEGWNFNSGNYLFTTDTK